MINNIELRVSRLEDMLTALNDQSQPQTIIITPLGEENQKGSAVKASAIGSNWSIEKDRGESVDEFVARAEREAPKIGEVRTLAFSYR